MNTIKKQPDLGGNLSLYIIPTIDVSNIEGNKIYFTGADPTIEIECSAETIRHTAKAVSSDSGIPCDHIITGFLPGRSDANAAILEKLKAYRFIVIRRDAAGNYLRVGDMDYGLKMEYEYDTSDDPSKTEGYSLTFSGILPYESRKVEFPPVKLEN